MSSHINHDNTIPNLEIVEHTHMEVGYRISLGSLTIPADITIIYKVGNDGMANTTSIKIGRDSTWGSRQEEAI